MNIFKLNVCSFHSCNNEDSNTPIVGTASLYYKYSYDIKITLRLAGLDPMQKGESSTSDQATKAKRITRIRQAPAIVQPLQAVQVESGKKVELTCQFTGSQPLKTFWEKDGRRLADSFELQMVETTDRSTLTISKAKYNSVGVYTVTVENSAGKVQSSAKVDVVEKAKGDFSPKFHQGLLDVQQSGGETQFCVKVTGKPKPTVLWFKDNTQIVPDSRHSVKMDQDTYFLIISDTCPLDAGTYECVVRNIHGEARCRANLTVSVAGGLPASANKKLNFRNRRRQCKFDQPLALTVRLHSQNAESFVCIGYLCLRTNRFVINYRLREALLLPVASLKSVSAPDRATATSETLLTVRVHPLAELSERWPLKGQPRLPPATGLLSSYSTDWLSATTGSSSTDDLGAAPCFERELISAECLSGAPVRFSCKIVGEVETVVWKKDGQIMQNGEDFVQTYDAHTGWCTMNIVESFCEDTGVISCHASNKYGDAVTSAFLKVNESSHTESGVEVAAEVSVTESEDYSLPGQTLRWITALENGTLSVDEAMKLTVEVEGYPSRGFCWSLDDKPLDRDSRFKIVTRGSVSTLSAKPPIPGVYQVTAANQWSQCASTCSIDVGKAPPLKKMHKEEYHLPAVDMTDMVPPRITKHIQSLTVAPNTPLELYIEYMSKTPAHVECSSVYISAPISGCYCAKVKNDYGTSTSVAFVKVKGEFLDFSIRNF
uniref:Ig-like domain-containing protein n=1 Tax=Trichuris muris TaxID=70415 RepID=A0A5S6Q2M7_TRIMR